MATSGQRVDGVLPPASPAGQPKLGAAPGELQQQVVHGYSRAYGAYQNFIASRAQRKPQPHELDPKIAWQAVVESARGYPKAALSPYVLDKFIKVAGPILGMCAVVWLLGRLLILPVTVLSYVIGTIIPGMNASSINASAQRGLHSMIGVIAVLSMTFMRQVLHKPIFKCFIHTLRDVNPPLAAELESAPTLPSAPPPSKAQRQQKHDLPEPIARLWKSRLGRAMILALVTHFWRQIPYLRAFAAPVMLFYASERLLGTERAMAVAGVSMLPGVGHYAIIFLDLWRSSHAVGQELLTDYMTKRIPGEQREGFVRSNEVAIFAFLLPQLLMFQLPIVGPLLFLPASAGAAYLANFLDRLPSNKRFRAADPKSDQ